MQNRDLLELDKSIIKALQTASAKFDKYYGVVLQSLPYQVGASFDFNVYKKIVRVSSDIESYITDPCVKHRRGFDVLTWWREHAKVYPLMAQIARDYLAIPMGSVSVERLFNSARDQFGVRRHRLAPETLQQLMVVQYSERNKKQ